MIEWLNPCSFYVGQERDGTLIAWWQLLSWLSQTPLQWSIFKIHGPKLLFLFIIEETLTLALILRFWRWGNLVDEWSSASEWMDKCLGMVMDNWGIAHHHWVPQGTNGWRIQVLFSPPLLTSPGVLPTAWPGSLSLSVCQPRCWPSTLTPRLFWSSSTVGRFLRNTPPQRGAFGVPTRQRWTLTWSVSYGRNISSVSVNP